MCVHMVVCTCVSARVQECIVHVSACTSVCAPVCMRVQVCACARVRTCVSVHVREAF